MSDAQKHAPVDRTRLKGTKNKRGTKAWYRCPRKDAAKTMSLNLHTTLQVQDPDNVQRNYIWFSSICSCRRQFQVPSQRFIVAHIIGGGGVAGHQSQRLWISTFICHSRLLNVNIVLLDWLEGRSSCSVFKEKHLLIGELRHKGMNIYRYYYLHISKSHPLSS